MTNAGSRGRNHHTAVCDVTIWEVDIEPARMNTLTRDRPIASS